MFFFFLPLLGNSNGRKAIIDEKIIPVLAQLFEDEEVMARKNSHKTIEMISELPFGKSFSCIMKFDKNQTLKISIYLIYSNKGAEAIVELRLIERLVERLKHEIDEIVELILDTLHFCMFVDTRQALQSKAMSVFTNLLSHDSAAIKSKAARDIFDLRHITFVLSTKVVFT